MYSSDDLSKAAPDAEIATAATRTGQLEGAGKGRGFIHAIMRRQTIKLLVILVVLVGTLNAWAQPTVTITLIASAPPPPTSTSTGKAYYFSPSGHDSSDCRSPGTACRSIAKVNAMTFSASDQILFEGGATFPGQISLGSGTGGTTAAPVVVTSYGTGRATISASNSSGFVASNTGNFEIRNLNFTGVNRTTNGHAGILISNSGATQYTHVYLTDVDVQQFDGGILVIGWPSTGGYDDVRLLRVVSHDNLKDGAALWTAADAVGTFSNLYVGYSQFYNNLGVPKPVKGGNGLWFNGVNHGTIEYSQFHDNGGSSDGNYGFWMYDSSNVTVQHSEAYNNHTGATKDGGGFDIDGGCQQCVIQYSYAHGNDGAGFALIAAGPNPQPWQNNVVRFSISENDGRKNSAGGIMLYGDSIQQYGTDGRPLVSFDIYQCTVYTTPPPSGTGRAVMIFDHAVTSAGRIRNSIFQASSGAEVVNIGTGNTDLLFQGNDYWADGTLSIFNGGTAYSSLDAWRTATGQETLDGQLTGRSLAPQFANPGVGSADGYRLPSSSSMIDAGVDLATLGINAGGRDYFGDVSPQGGFDIGADEAGSAL